MLKRTCHIWHICGYWLNLVHKSISNSSVVLQYKLCPHTTFIIVNSLSESGKKTRVNIRHKLIALDTSKLSTHVFHIVGKVSNMQDCIHFIVRDFLLKSCKRLRVRVSHVTYIGIKYYSSLLIFTRLCKLLSHEKSIVKEIKSIVTCHRKLQNGVTTECCWAWQWRKIYQTNRRKVSHSGKL